MEMVQRLSIENGKIVEKRHEMILAHEKFGVKIKNITEEYGISVGSYYYWSDRYAREGFLGLINKKTGARVPYNKAPEDIETKIVQIASDNKELDADGVWDIVTELYGFDKTVRTVERILQRHQINRRRGRRSKKTTEKKRTIIQVQKRALTK